MAGFAIAMLVDDESGIDELFERVDDVDIVHIFGGGHSLCGLEREAADHDRRALQQLLADADSFID